MGARYVEMGDCMLGLLMAWRHEVPSVKMKGQAKILFRNTGRLYTPSIVYRDGRWILMDA